jgi:uncharacterized surface protein with fasciclin (FAS1) repeats
MISLYVELLIVSLTLLQATLAFRLGRIGSSAIPSSTSTVTQQLQRSTQLQTRLWGSLLETIEGDPSFSVFSQLLAGVPDLKTLMGDEDVGGSGGANIMTVLAPNNAAFAKLNKDQLFKLGKKDNLPILRKLVRFHVHEDVLRLDDFVTMSQVKEGTLSTLALVPVSIKPAEGGKSFRINEAKIIRELPLCSNGVVYEVDTLVNPVLIYRYLV